MCLFSVLIKGGLKQDQTEKRQAHISLKQNPGKLYSCNVQWHCDSMPAVHGLVDS